MLETLWQRGTELLGTKYAILGGAMSWISERNLVAAISNSGGFGVIACGAMNSALLDKEIKATRALTSNPFGVNLITMHPHLDELIDICIANAVSHIVLAGGLPKQESIKKIKSHNIKLLGFAPALGIAKKLVKSGIDAIIIEGMEAGGHIGPISTSVLAQEILPFIKEVPVFVAGGIGNGTAIASYLLMGAAGCQLGTKFVCTHESIAHKNFKNIFIKSSARDAVASVQISADFPVIAVRALVNKASKDFTEVQKNTINEFNEGKLDKIAAQLKIEHYWAGALRKAVIDGDIENGSLMAGQSVGMVEKEQSVQEVMDELVAEANKYLENCRIALKSQAKL